MQKMNTDQKKREGNQSSLPQTATTAQAPMPTRCQPGTQHRSNNPTRKLPHPPIRPLGSTVLLKVFPLGPLGPNFWVPNCRIQLFACEGQPQVEHRHGERHQARPHEHKHQRHGHHPPLPGNHHHTLNIRPWSTLVQFV